jgi:hypothetical protein
MKTYHSQAVDLISLGNFADAVKRRWGHLGVYLDRHEPRDDRCHLGPNRWRLAASHLIVAEHIGGIVPEAKRGQPCTWDMAWIAETPSEFLPATQRIPPKRQLSVGFVGDGIDARKVKTAAPHPRIFGGGGAGGDADQGQEATPSAITFCGRWSEADKATMTEWLGQHYPEALA